MNLKDAYNAVKEVVARYKRPLTYAALATAMGATAVGCRGNNVNVGNGGVNSGDPCRESSGYVAPADPDTVYHVHSGNVEHRHVGLESAVRVKGRKGDPLEK